MTSCYSHRNWLMILKKAMMEGRSRDLLDVKKEVTKKVRKERDYWRRRRIHGNMRTDRAKRVM